MRKSLTIYALLAGALTALAGSTASASRISPGYETSWGKAGVMFSDYWTDANECGQQAANMDLSGTAPAEALVLASRILDTYGASYGGFNGMAPTADAIRIGSPEVQWNRAATIMRHELENCLTGRGYVKFKLTKSQARHLKGLEAGSLERRMYLHSLASDPAVLNAQTIKES